MISISRKLKGFSMNFAFLRNPRTRGSVVKKNILGSGLIKIISIAISFFTVPMVLNILDQESYGIWLTLSSIFYWIMYFDIGLGRGLRNKYAESLAKNDINSAKSYVSTAYFSIGTVGLGFIAIFLLINPYLEWSTILNIQDKDGENYSLITTIIFPMFCLQFILNLIKSILIADQKSAGSELLNLASSSLIFGMLSYYSILGNASLTKVAIIFSGAPVIVLLITSAYMFLGPYNHVVPEYKFAKKEYLLSIGTIGVKFFIIQICGLVTVSTTNVIVANLFSPAEVVPYSLVYRYFFYVLVAFNLISNPLYGAMTEAYAKGDIFWIKNALKKVNYISIIFVMGLGFMILVSGSFFKMWIGDTVNISLLLTIFMAIYFAQTIMITVYAVFISAVGALKISFIFSIINATIHIPLTIYMGRRFGLVGIVLALIVPAIPGLYWLPAQTYKILNNKAKGIWGVNG